MASTAAAAPSSTLASASFGLDAAAPRNVSVYLAPNARLSYGDLVDSLQRVGALQAEKKNVVKLLEDAAMFDIDMAMLPGLLSVLLTFDDPPIVRNAYTCLSRMSDDFAGEMKEKISGMLTKDISSPSFHRRIFALRVAGRILDKDALLSMCRLIIKGIDSDEVYVVKKRVGKSSGISPLRQQMLEEVMLVCRTRLFDIPDTMELALVGLKSSDSSATYHALALATSLLRVAPAKFVPLLAPFFEHFPDPAYGDKKPNSLPMSDFLVRRQVVSLVAEAANLPPGTREFDHLRQLSFRALGRFVDDGSDQINVFALLGLARVGWRAADQHGTSDPSTPLVPKFVGRAALLLQHAKRDLVTSLCSAIALFAQSARVAQVAEMPLLRLAGQIKNKLNDTDLALRISALRAVIWIDDNPDDLRPYLDAEFQRGEVTMDQSVDMFVALRGRTQSSPKFCGVMLGAVIDWVRRMPERVNTDLLELVLRTAMAVDRDGTLKTVFDILDHDDPKRREFLLRTHRFLYWFIGEHFHTLSGYELFQPAMTTISNYQNDGFAVDLLLPALKAIVLRLEHAVHFAPWESRIAASRALSSIALRAMDPVRLHIFEFLSLCQRDEGLGISVILRPVLQLLFNVYRSRKAMLDKMRKGSVPKSELEWLKEENARLVNEMSFFAPVPNSFSPLGPEAGLALFGQKALAEASAASASAAPAAPAAGDGEHVNKHKQRLQQFGAKVKDAFHQAGEKLHQAGEKVRAAFHVDSSASAPAATAAAPAPSAHLAAQIDSLFGSS